MRTEVLVMCTECGRPQGAASPTCAHCGAPLPDVAFASRGDRAGEESTWQADLGRERSLGLSRDRLGWRDGEARDGFSLNQVTSVELRQRPLFELLAISIAAILGGLIAAQLWLQILMAGVAAASAIACFAWRSYALRVGLKDGKAVHVPLLTAGAGAPKDRVDRMWQSLSSQLERRGVSTGAGSAGRVS